MTLEDKKETSTSLSIWILVGLVVRILTEPRWYWPLGPFAFVRPLFRTRRRQAAGLPPLVPLCACRPKKLRTSEPVEHLTFIWSRSHADTCTKVSPRASVAALRGCLGHHATAGGPALRFNSRLVYSAAEKALLLHVLLTVMITDPS